MNEALSCPCSGIALNVASSTHNRKDHFHLPMFSGNENWRFTRCGSGKYFGVSMRNNLDLYEPSPLRSVVCEYSRICMTSQCRFWTGDKSEFTSGRFRCSVWIEVFLNAYDLACSRSGQIIDFRWLSRSNGIQSLILCNVSKSDAL
jgi:hypothetical protein